jgi:hypothetical protein
MANNVKLRRSSEDMSSQRHLTTRPVRHSTGSRFVAEPAMTRRLLLFMFASGRS